MLDNIDIRHKYSISALLKTFLSCKSCFLPSYEGVTFIHKMVNETKSYVLNMIWNIQLPLKHLMVRCIIYHSNKYHYYSTWSSLKYEQRSLHEVNIRFIHHAKLPASCLHRYLISIIPRPCLKTDDLQPSQVHSCWSPDFLCDLNTMVMLCCINDMILAFFYFTMLATCSWK